LKLLERLKPFADDANVWFDCAKAYAVLGKQEQAVASMRKAFLDGFADYRRVAEAQELGGLRETPAFRETLAAAKMLQSK
jgi:hypothetical protein